MNIKKSNFEFWRMTGVEPASGGVTIHCLDHLATPARKKTRIKKMN